MISWPFAWARYGRHWPTPVQRAWPTVRTLLPVRGGYSLVTSDVTFARMHLLGHQMGHLNGPHREAVRKIISVWRARANRAKP